MRDTLNEPIVMEQGGVVYRDPPGALRYELPGLWWLVTELTY
jgi:hypothetical protein